MSKVKRNYMRVTDCGEEAWRETILESIKRTHKKTIIAAECRWVKAALADYVDRNKLLNPAYAQQQRDVWKPVSEHDEIVRAEIASTPRLRLSSN